MRRVDSCTYEIAGGLFVEKMADGSWTAYRPVDADARYEWLWSSPKHSTRRAAISSARIYWRKTRGSL